MIKRLLLRAALLLAVLLPATPAMAWWEYGHGAVGRIAYLNVSPQTRTQVDRLLRQVPWISDSHAAGHFIDDAVRTDRNKPGPRSIRHVKRSIRAERDADNVDERRLICESHARASIGIASERHRHAVHHAIDRPPSKCEK